MSDTVKIKQRRSTPQLILREGESEFRPLSLSVRYDATNRVLIQFVVETDGVPRSFVCPLSPPVALALSWALKKAVKDYMNSQEMED